MEHGACNLIYVDQRAKERTLRRNSTASLEAQPADTGTTPSDYFKPDGGNQQQEIQSSIDSLLSIFATGTKNDEMKLLGMPNADLCMTSSHLFIRLSMSC
jgi:hypothetical protein